MREWINIIESVETASVITRWIDTKGALSYIRRDAMVGRVRHWLPKQISGLDKIYPKTGLSFALPNTRSNWNAHGEQGICFVADRNLISNQICDIDGHSVFLFSQEYDDYRRGMGGHNLTQSRDLAIQDSLTKPDEAFVIGDIRNLHAVLTKIIIGAEIAPKAAAEIMAYSEKFNIPLQTT